MGKHSKPDLDPATLRIARTLLNTPPKPHEEMKVGKAQAKRIKRKSPKVRAKT